MAHAMALSADSLPVLMLVSVWLYAIRTAVHYHAAQSHPE